MRVAAAFANALRNEVQTVAPETKPVFATLAKEIDLRNALKVMDKRVQDRKALGLYDIVAGVGGFATLGPGGAAGAIAAEKVLRSPAVGLGAAKVIPKVLPTANTLGRATRAPAEMGLSKILAGEPRDRR